MRQDSQPISKDAVANLLDLRKESAALSSRMSALRWETLVNCLVQLPASPENWFRQLEESSRQVMVDLQSVWTRYLTDTVTTVKEWIPPWSHVKDTIMAPANAAVRSSLIALGNKGTNEEQAIFEKLGATAENMANNLKDIKPLKNDGFASFF